MTQLAPTTEIVSSLLSNLCHRDDELREAVFQDAKAVAFARFNVEIKDELVLHVVQNNDNVVNLSLPYYENVTQLGASGIDDTTLADVAGGDVITAIIFAIVGAVGLSIAAGTAGAVGGGIAAADAK